jgi:phenylacetate-CoA ligase
VCSLEGWRVQRQRYGAGFAGLLATLEQRSAWPAARLDQLRDARLAAFVRESASVPAYRERLRAAGAEPADIRGLTDLARLPLLGKAEVQADTAAFTSHAVPDRERLPAHTSGTTGAGLRFSTTRAAAREQWAVWWRYRRWHGIERRTWCGYFGGRSVVPLAQHRPPFWRYNVPGRQILFSAYHMSPDHLALYAGELWSRGIAWLHGYPSLLALLAAHILEHGPSVAGRIRWVTTGAENLLPQQRRLLLKAFGVEPREHYGLAEAVANFSECTSGLLHVDEDFAAVEFLPAGRDSWTVVGTNFSNLATPLIRYDTGDVVELGDGTCSCGRPGRIVRRVDGRQEDYVVLPSGARIGRLDHAFKDLVHIHEAQLLQRRVGEVVVRVVPGPGYDAAERGRLIDALGARLGSDTVVRIEQVTAVERSPTGKLRFVVSELPEGRLVGTAR